MRIENQNRGSSTEELCNANRMNYGEFLDAEASKIINSMGRRFNI